MSALGCKVVATCTRSAWASCILQTFPLCASRGPNGRSSIGVFMLLVKVLNLGSTTVSTAKTGIPEMAVAGAADFTSGTLSVVQSDLGGDDCKPDSALKMAFCTAG